MIQWITADNPDSMTTDQPKTKKQHGKFYVKLTLTLVFFIVIAPLSSAQARVFDPNNIISDQDLWTDDQPDLTKTSIQKFLERKNSVLARFSEIVDGQSKSAAQLIWQASKLHGVSAKFLLATLEKEKGLLTKSQATEKELEWATGFSCFGGGCNEKYRGFFNQVESTAITQNIYRQKAGQFGFRLGQTTDSFDGYAVTPVNQATTNLYVYTPYVGNAPELGISFRFGGNKLFWKIWNRYFTNQKYPDGSVIKYGNDYALIKGNQKRLFASRDIFLSDYTEDDAIIVDFENWNAYPSEANIKFSNNTLVRSSASGQAFLISGSQRRPIVDESALAILSDVRIAVSSLSEIPSFNNDELSAYSVGNPITLSSQYPQGKLFRDELGNLYLVQDNLKHPLDPAVWQLNYNSATPEIASAVDLELYPTGDGVKIKDGKIVKNTAGNYYIISDQEKLKIEGADIVSRIFGAVRLASALTIPDEVMDLHESGLNIEYIDNSFIDPPEPVVVPVPAGGSYEAQFVSLEPELIMFVGQEKQITVSIKNIGGTHWQQGDVWLETDVTNQRYSFNQTSVSSSQVGTFSITLKAPNNIGLQPINFTLYHNAAEPEPITNFGKFFLVKTGNTADIVSHDLPIAVLDNWRPVPVTMKIKNTSSEGTEWTSNKTALKIMTLEDGESPFYDESDWVKADIAAVPVNKSTIAPGEVGEFSFTLEVREAAAGIHNLKFILHLVDQDKFIMLNGSGSWVRQMRVDES